MKKIYGRFLRKIYLLLFILPLPAYCAPADSGSVPLLKIAELIDSLASAPVPHLEQFPKDTMQRFIQNYGKDSLLHLIDNRIQKAIEYINPQTAEIRDPFSKVQLELVARHFKLKMDTVSFAGSGKEAFTMSLYGNIFRSVDNTEMMQGIASSTMNLDSLIYSVRYDKNAIENVIAYCKYLPLSNSIIDSLNKFSEYLPYGGPVYGKLEMYLMVTRLLNSGCGNPEHLKQLKQELGSYLRKVAVFKEVGTYLEKAPNMIDMLRAVAYGLYGKDLNQEDGRLLLFLLAAQRTDGGWSEFNSPKHKNTPLPTVFGIWSLLEFRALLKQ